MVASSERTAQQIIKHRLRNTEKEKRRNVDINAAFYNLQWWVQSPSLYPPFQ